MTQNEGTGDRRMERGKCCPEDASADCCSMAREPGQDGQIPKVRSWGRTALLAAVILTAVLLSARALMREAPAEVADPHPDAGLATGAAGSPLLGRKTVAPPSPGASPSSCCPAVSSGTEVTSYAAGKDAIFLILSGDRPGEVNAVTDQVNVVVKALTARGKQVDALTFDRNTPGYGELAQAALVETYPCVIALGPSGQLSSVEGEITEDGLLRAFVEATMPSMSCDTPCAAPEACGE